MESRKQRAGGRISNETHLLQVGFLRFLRLAGRVGRSQARHDALRAYGQVSPSVSVARLPRFTVGRCCSYVVTASVAAMRHRPMTMLAHRRRAKNLECRIGFSKK